MPFPLASPMETGALGSIPIVPFSRIEDSSRSAGVVGGVGSSTTVTHLPFEFRLRVLGWNSAATCRLHFEYVMFDHVAVSDAPVLARGWK